MENKNNHSFSVEIATSIGLEAAIVLQHLYYWCYGNSDNKEMTKDGFVWVYISRAKIAKNYPYLKEGKIKGAINKLKENGYILIGNYNQMKMDKTNWYALTDKAYELFGTSLAELTNGWLKSPTSGEDNQAIQSIETIYNKKDSKEDTKVSKKDDLFEDCWKAYRRKGSKKNALVQWNKLKEEERKNILLHIKQYVLSVSDVKYQKDFERYLRDKTFMTVVYKDNQVIYDPERVINGYYSPQEHAMLYWNDYYKHYITMQEPGYLGFVDGYDDDNRPDEATVYYGGYPYKWSKKDKKWTRQS